MSYLDYAIGILKDDINELSQMQAVTKYAMEGKLYTERTNSLHAAIEKLEQANSVTTGKKQFNLPVVLNSAIVQMIHSDLAIKANEIMKQHDTMKVEDFRELPEVKRLWNAMDVIKENYL